VADIWSNIRREVAGRGGREVVYVSSITSDHSGRGKGRPERVQEEGGKKRKIETNLIFAG